MSLYNAAIDIGLRLKDSLKGTGIYRRYANLKREQYLSRGEIEELQRKRLISLLKKAQEKSGYYRQLIHNLGLMINNDFRLEHLDAFPLLTRDILQNNFEKMLCSDAQNIYKNSSGGSTGNPVNFYQDLDYRMFSEACELLFYDWMHVSQGDKKALLWGSDRDLKAAGRYEKMMRSVFRIKILDSFTMTEEKIGVFIMELNRYKPKYIQGYASSLHWVARYILQNSSLAFKPAAIRSAAEMLYDSQRRDIEKAFGAPVYNFYGSREVNNIAGECSHHEGLHILESGRILEIVDDKGQPTPDGRPGHIVVTDLTNLAFPFIRYLNGDMATIRKASCSCGRGYRLLENILGRASDIIVINGNYIHGEYFTHLFYNHPEVKQFQLIQESDTEIRILIVSTNAEINFEGFRQKIIEKVGGQINLTFQAVDDIPPLSTGKYRFTVSKLVKR